MLSRRGGDRPPRWMVLDAKWRAGRANLGKAFESVHLYRDALHDTTCGGRCVAAALLCPARSADADEWFQASFRDAFGCGAFALTPGAPPDDDLRGWLLAVVC